MSCSLFSFSPLKLDGHFLDILRVGILFYISLIPCPASPSTHPSRRQTRCRNAGADVTVTVGKCPHSASQEAGDSTESAVPWVILGLVKGQIFGFSAKAPGVSSPHGGSSRREGGSEGGWIGHGGGSAQQASQAQLPLEMGEHLEIFFLSLSFFFFSRSF